MGAGASLGSPNALQLQDLINELNAKELNELTPVIQTYWKAQTPQKVGKGPHARWIDPELPPAKNTRRLTLHYVGAVQRVQKKLEIANTKLLQGKPFMDEKIEKFEKQLQQYKTQLCKAFPPMHSIDGSVDSRAAEAALEVHDIANADARQQLIGIVFKAVSGPRRFQFDKMLAKVVSGEAAVADFSYMSLTDDQLHQVVEAIVNSPSTKGIFALRLQGNVAITGAGVRRSISGLLLPAVAAGPRAKRFACIDLRGLTQVGDDAGLEAAFPKISPNALQIVSSGTRVSRSGAEVLRNDGGAKLRREATLMGVLAEAASDHRELGLFVALSGY